MTNTELRHRLEAVFTPPQVEVLADWVEEYQRNLVKAGDFNELKEIVRDLAEEQRNLAEAQRRTEGKVEELAEAQRRTEGKVEELVAAQRQTEIQLKELAASMQRLADAQTGVRQDLNGVSRSLEDFRRQEGANAQTLGYLLENEAYRNLPQWLERQHGIEVTGRMIRQVVGEEEIDLLVEARQGADEVLLVGESKSRVNLSDLGILAARIESVRENYYDLRGRRIVPLLVAHHAPEKALARAKQEGIILVQSFEW